MKNLKLGVKLIGGFSLVAAITLVVGIIGWWGVGKLEGDLTEIGDVRLPSIEELMKAELVMEEIMLVHRTMMTEQIDLEQRQHYLAGLKEHWQRLDQTWARFLELPATDEEGRLSNQFEQQLADWRKLDEQWRQQNQNFESLDILNPAELVANLQRFRGDHYVVQLGVSNLIQNDRAFQGGADPTTCNFGRWLAGFSTQNRDIQGMIAVIRTNHDTFHHAVTDIREAMKENNRTAAQRLFSEVMQPAAEGVFASFEQMIKAAEQANTLRTEMTALVLGPMYSEATEAMDILKNLIHINEEIAKNAVAQGHANAVLAETTAIAGAIIGTLLALGLGIILTRSLTGPVGKSVEMIEALASGNLDLRLNFDRKDEIGRLAHAMDAFADNLRDEVLGAFENLAGGNLTFEATGLIREPLSRANAALTELITQLQMSGEQIASGAGQVADSSQSLSQGATESAASLEEISASLNQLSSQTSTNAENANTANQLAGEARSAAQQGSQKMQEMVTAMGDINEAGQSISKIIKVIDEIAFQTNLLALNAAVEAARAGQHGKGFAVVAEEVRNLAARSAKAAQETSELIEGSVQKTANGSAIADQTATALESIVTGIGKVTDLVAEIAAASSEQAQGVNEINQGISQIDQVTQQNTASAEEGAAAAEELSGQAAQMREMLMRFTLKHGISSHSNMRKIPQKSASSGSWGGSTATKHAPKRIAAKQPIALDDDEYGKY